VGRVRLAMPTAGPAASPDVLERRRAALTFATGGVVIAVGGAAALGARSLGLWTDLGPGPGFFPLCLGILLVVFGLAWLGKVARARATSGGTAARSANAHLPAATQPAGTATSLEAVPDPAEEFPEYSLPTVLAIVGSLIALAASLEVLGYQLAMLLFLLFHLLVLGRRRLLLSLVIAFTGSIGVFVIFTRFLTVPLPASSIPLLRDLGF
jgi:putative tricarboxylic transport membrane protein